MEVLLCFAFKCNAQYWQTKYTCICYMGTHKMKGAANGVLRVLQRMSRDIRCNIYIAPEILCDNATTALDKRLATTALHGTRTAFNARLATLDTQLVRTALDKRLVKTALDDRNRKYAHNYSNRQYTVHVNTKQTKDRQQPNYTNTCTKNKFSGHCSSGSLFLSASHSENTLYAHVMFFLVFAGTNPFDNTNTSSSFDEGVKWACFFGVCLKTAESFRSSFTLNG